MESTKYVIGNNLLHLRSTAGFLYFYIELSAQKKGELHQGVRCQNKTNLSMLDINKLDGLTVNNFHCAFKRYTI